MKKLKKTIAILLCLCMLAGTAVIGASAYTDEEIWAIKGELLNNIRALYWAGEDKYVSWDTTARPIYTDETLLVLYTACRDAEMYSHSRGDEDWIYTVTIEELTRVYNNLETAFDGLKVAVHSLQELYNAVKGEENGTEGYLYRYYPERMWREFCAARQTAADVLLNPDDDSVTGAYFALRRAYNTLCTSRQTAGDIDGNSSVEVADVLYLQKYLAKIIPMNSSQKAAAILNERNTGKITMKDVMTIQRYLAGYEEELYSYCLHDIQEYDRNILIDEGKLI